ncbi:hypothetical protein YC2023_098066 [Brassica napus]
MFLAFLKPTLRAKNPLRVAGASGGRFTCFERNWLRREELVEERSKRGGVWADRMASSVEYSGHKWEELDGSLLQEHRK